MQTTQETFIPILFNVLFGFVALNIVVNFILLYARRLRINKLLAAYWPIILINYLIQGSFQNGQLNIALAYSATMVGSLMTAVIGFEAIGRTFPWKKYVIGFLPLYPLTIWLDSLGFGFTVITMPIAIATALPLAHAFLFMNIIDRKSTTRLQKVLGIIYSFHAIHCINFAIFRMDAGAQLWGWLVSYALCDFLAILLPSISLELASLNENVRMQQLVDEKTEDLNKSMKNNENLLKVLIHDISNPLMVIKANLFFFREKRDTTDKVMGSIQKSQETIEDIIDQVKSIYNLKKTAKLPLTPVAIEECFNDVSFIFEQPLRHKNVSLHFNNQLAKDTLVMADKTTLTHSVLSNLVSNGLKFTSPHSKIEITAREFDNSIILEVKDEGPGIPKSIIDNVMNNNELRSTYGTLGEAGNGFGLSIVKSFVDSYGGQFEIDSSLLHAAQTKDFGTNVKITLDRA